MTSLLQNYDNAEQLTVALEDEISLSKAINVPVNISAGISYDAQNLWTYKARANVGQPVRVTTYSTTLDRQVYCKR